MSKRIAIVGAGAVGSYYGARLAQAGNDVVFLLRSDYERVKECGLQVKSVAGDFFLEKVQCARSSGEIGVVDLVIVAWKTTSNTKADEVIRPLVDDNTILLTLQNGLGNCEHLAALFGADRVMAGLCFVCINRLSAGVIEHSAAGLIRLGEFVGGQRDRLGAVAAMFRAAKVPCEAVDSLELAQWMKLVWNFPFNGLAIAEGGVDTAVLLKELGLECLLRALMAEIVAVAGSLGHEISEDFIDEQIEITHPMGGYRPSSMIDFVEGREVEYDAIWGLPLEMADRSGLAVPEMRRLAARIELRISERNQKDVSR